MSNQVTGFGQMDELFGTEGAVLTQEREPRELVVVPVITQGPIGGHERENDLAVARETMHRVLTKAEDALDDVLKIARASESARSFEVAGQMVKTMADLTNQLVDLHKKAKELEDEDKPTQVVQNIENQNVFTGSAAELMQQVRMSREKVINPDVV